MRTFYILGIIALIVLLTGSAQAAPGRPGQPTMELDALPAIDYNCDGYIAFGDAAVMVDRLGSNVALDLWAFDLDNDGSITTYDIGIVAAEVGRDDLPAPVWCD